MSKWMLGLWVAVALATVNARADGAGLYFLRDGDVWVCTLAGENENRLTATGGAVEDYRVSPDGGLLAYLKIINVVEAPGVWKKVPAPTPGVPSAAVPPTRPVGAVVVQDLRKNVGSILEEITPPHGNWFYLKTWLENDKLLYIGASGFDVWGHFVYDARRDRSRKISDYHGYRLVYGNRLDLDRKGRRLVYVEAALDRRQAPREELVLLNLDTQQTDTLLTRDEIRWPRFSQDGQRVAFLESTYADGHMRETLMVLEPGRAVRELYAGPLQPKSERILEWAPDDRHVLLGLKPNALLLPLEATEKTIEVPGSEAVWLDSQTVLMESGPDLMAFDMTNRTSRAFLIGASSPTVARTMAP